MRLPTFYIPHGGGPCFFMDWNPADEWDRMAAYLRGLPAAIGAVPKAVLVISAHWEEAVVTIQKNPAPPLLYDYSGFPPHTYKIGFPAPGDPALADRIAGLLVDAGIESRFDTDRGFDHGVFIPLKLAWPEPEIPMLQVSLRADLDPAAHIALGRALAPLRDEGVVIIGSGMSFHNMQTLMRPSEPGSVDPDSVRFDDWLSQTLTDIPAINRTAALTNWAAAPGARQSHPREEHLLPLHVAVGAALEDPGRQTLSDQVLGVAISAFQFG